MNDLTIKNSCGELDSNNYVNNKSFFQKQRRLLSVDRNLYNKPVLCFSSHKNGEYEDKKSEVIDLTGISAEQLIVLLNKYAKNVYDKDSIITNIIWLPPLDDIGNSSKGPSTTFAIDKGNFDYMILKLQKFLDGKGVLISDGMGVKSIEGGISKKLDKVLY